MGGTGKAAAVYLTAALESILEDLAGRCLGVATASGGISSAHLEQVIAASGEHWGMFQVWCTILHVRICFKTLIPSCSPTPT